MGARWDASEKRDGSTVNPEWFKIDDQTYRLYLAWLSPRFNLVEFYSLSPAGQRRPPQRCHSRYVYYR